MEKVQNQVIPNCNSFSLQKSIAMRQNELCVLIGDKNCFKMSANRDLPLCSDQQDICLVARFCDPCTLEEKEVYETKIDDLPCTVRYFVLNVPRFMEYVHFF
jgi:hypothetical protein